jgi:predicted house-cleaning noncanonical NTP pyrophosphatase (MazG superfamily)
MLKTYNKLVRDRIPEIIEASGASCTIEILSNERYLEMLNIKLSEELAEYQEEQNIEELADLLEVIYAVAIARGFSFEKLEALRAKKFTERGGFEKKILLIETIEYNK